MEISSLLQQEYELPASKSYFFRPSAKSRDFFSLQNIPLWETQGTINQIYVLEFILRAWNMSNVTSA